MNKNIVSIIRSPFQLLCFCEFISENLIVEYECHIILNTEKEKDQCNRIKNTFKLNFSSIIVVNSLLEIFKLNFFLKKYNTLIIGHLFDNICLVSTKIIFHKKLVILDDGVSSLAIKDKLSFNKSPYDDFLGFKQKIFDFFIKAPKKFTLFTIFHEHLDLDDNINLVPNNFHAITSDLEYQKLNSTVYFIGTPVVEDGLISMINFNNFFRNFKEFNMIYFPHRREEIDNLKNIELQGVKLNFSQIPFELFLIESKKLPSKIISFNSSVLFTSRAILKTNFDKVDFYYIELDNTVTEKKIDSHLIKIQNFYKKLGYNKINFHVK